MTDLPESHLETDCPYCGKPKRGWRRDDPNALCSECERRVDQ